MGTFKDYHRLAKQKRHEDGLEQTDDVLYHYVAEFVARPDDLSSIFRPSWWKERSNFCKNPLVLSFET